jgi:hypothetical protein
MNADDGSMRGTAELDLLCINTLRTLAIDAVQKANSGHPGTPMGAAPVAFALWLRPERSCVAESRSLRAVCGTRVRVALWLAAPLWREDARSARQG